MIKKFLKYIINIFISYSNDIVYIKKISNIYKLLTNRISVKFDSNLLKAHKKKWSILKKPIIDKWLKVYTIIYGKCDINFIPENIYYNIVEPRLNNKMFDMAYADKNFYDKHFDIDVFPYVYLRNINGVFYDHHYRNFNFSQKNLYDLFKNEKKVLIKKSIDTSGGRDVEILSKNGDIFINKYNQKLTKQYLLKNYHNNFLIQKYIEQHNYFKQFNNSSVNTVRVMTYRSVRNEEIMILSSVLRIGKPGSIVDNQASGGISCGINKKGELNDYIVDKYGNKKEITEILNDFKNNIKVYKYNEIIKVAKKIAQKNLYHRILGLDFCVGINDKIYLLEINNKNIEINFLQMNNGPLFREYTDEVIEFCKNMPKSIVLDFWV